MPIIKEDRFSRRVIPITKLPPKYSLLSYFKLTYAITWGIAAVYILFPGSIEHIFGPISVYHPLYFVAVYAPSLAALFVTGRRLGLKGCKDLLARMFRWNIGLRWYLFLLFYFAAIHIALRFAAPLWKGQVPDIAYSWYGIPPLALFYLIADAGPIGEELGWSGLALPLLQRRFHPVIAALILGVIWSLWHLPAFFIANLNQSSYTLILFIINLTCLRLFMTVVFNTTKGSVFVVVVMHWLNNLGTYMNLTGNDPITSCINAMLYLIAAIVLFVLISPQPFKNPTPGWPTHAN